MQMCDWKKGSLYHCPLMLLKQVHEQHRLLEGIVTDTLP